MAFDGFVTKAVVCELNSILVGAKVNKVFEPTKNEIILDLYNQGNHYALNLCANPDFCRIGLTTHTKPNPQNAYNFCMLLRKYLIGAKILQITSYDLERTVEIQFETYNELNDFVIRKLYIEIMSRQSNIILTNENNIIIDTLKHFDNRVRELLPAHEYTFVPINKISFLKQDISTFLNTIHETSPQDLCTYFLNTYIGFSRPFITEILKQLSIDSTLYTDQNLENLYAYLQSIIQNLGTTKVSCKMISNKDYTLVLEDHLEPLAINSFLDDFYFQKEQNLDFKNSRNSLLKIIATSLKKVSKKLENINLKLKECENMEQFQLYGELLTANLYRIPANENLKEITLENYYDNYNPITIPLDNRISIHKNIEKYFKKYNKLKNTLAIVTKQKKEAEKELDYIESIVFNLENAKTMHDITEVYEEIAENVVTKKVISQNKKDLSTRKHVRDEMKFEKIDIDGFQIYIGKNNIQNDYISLKLADNHDIWFHTQKIHGSHILLRNPENLDISDIPEKILFTCAKLAKQNSKASTSLNVAVDYCLARYVKKASGAKPGMVIYTNFKTIIVK